MPERTAREADRIESEVREFIREQYPDSLGHDLRSSQVRGLIRSMARRLVELKDRIEALEQRKET